MSIIHLISILVRFAGCAWMVLIAAKLRDVRVWYIALLLVCAGIYHAWEAATLLHLQERFSIELGGTGLDLLGLCISMMVLLAVGVVGEMVSKGFRAEELLGRTAETFRELADQAADGIFTLSREGLFTAVNESMCRVTGRSREELLQTNITDLLPIPEIPSMVVSLEDILLGRKVVLDTHFLHSLEHLVPVEVSAKMLSDGAIVGTVRDLSERRKHEEQLAEAERKFGMLAQHLPGVIYLCRNDTRYSMLYLNDAVEELTGYSKDEFLRDEVSFVELYHPEDYNRVFADVDAALRRRESFALEYRIRHRDGSWKWVYEIGSGVWKGDELRYLEGFLADLTSHKQALQKLEGAQARYQQLADAISAGLCVVDRQGVVTYANQQLLQMLGYREDEFCGRCFHLFTLQGEEQELDRPAVVDLRHRNGSTTRVCVTKSRIERDAEEDEALLLISALPESLARQSAKADRPSA